MKSASCLDTMSTNQPDNRDERRPLEGRVIGISISESEELPALGLLPNAINVVTADLARRIIALGGSVIFGHDWRTGGVMEAVSRFAVAYAGQNARPEQPLILNYLAEPDRPSLSDLDWKTIESIVECKTFSWAGNGSVVLEQTFRAMSESRFGEKGYEALVATARQKAASDPAERALNLTAMRHFTARRSDVRIVLGGKTADYQGLAPGIVEEAWWQLLFGKRLIVCTGMCGAASALLDPESRPAGNILADKDHPLAGPCLRDIFSRDSSVDALVSLEHSLQVDAILSAMA